MSLARRSTHARLLITLLLLIGYVAALRASEPITFITDLRARVWRMPYLRGYTVGVFRACRAGALRRRVFRGPLFGLSADGRSKRVTA